MWRGGEKNRGGGGDGIKGMIGREMAEQEEGRAFIVSKRKAAITEPPS